MRPLLPVYTLIVLIQPHILLHLQRCAPRCPGQPDPRNERAMPGASLAHRCPSRPLVLTPPVTARPLHCPVSRRIAARFHRCSWVPSASLRVHPISDSRSPPLQGALHRPSRPHRMFLQPLPCTSILYVRNRLISRRFHLRLLSWLCLAVPLHFE